MGTAKYLLGPMRLPFLVLTPACVSLGLGTAAWSSERVSTLYFILALIGAISAHVSANAFNEYFDFKSGLDFRTQRTPFSGGSGTLPAKPKLAHLALRMALITLAVAGVIGLYFLRVRGLALLPLGALGLFLVTAYTPWLTRNPLLCLIAPGLGFGPLMVVGTDFVLTGEYSRTAIIASLIPFFLVNNLLLLNQFPDIAADKSVGRRHFPMIIGKRASCHIYGIFMLSAFLSIALGVNLDYLPATSLLGLAGLVVAVPTLIGVYRYAETKKRLIPFMYMNVLINIMTPVLVAIGLFMG